MTLKQIMKEIMSPHRARSEESLQGLNLGMFGMLYNLYSDLYGVLTVEIFLKEPFFFGFWCSLFPKMLQMAVVPMFLLFPCSQ